MPGKCKRVMALGKFEFRPGKGSGESRHAPRLEFTLTYDGEDPGPLMELLGENEGASANMSVKPKADDIEGWKNLCQIKQARWKPADSGRGVLTIVCYRETHDTNQLLDFVKMRFDMDTSEDAGADVTLTIVQQSLPFEKGEADDGKENR